LDELLREPVILRTGSSGTELETERFLSGLHISLDDLNIAPIKRCQRAPGSALSRASAFPSSPAEWWNGLSARPADTISLGKHKFMRNLYLVYMETDTFQKYV
jgi:hypothetical protein